MAPFNPKRLTIVTFLHAACAMGFLRTAYDATVTFDHGKDWVEMSHPVTRSTPSSTSPRKTPRPCPFTCSR